MIQEEDRRPEARLLLANIKGGMPMLLELRRWADEEWNGEDGIYRFYHTSFKGYRLQEITEKIVALFRSLNPKPGVGLHNFFEEIIQDGTGKIFLASHNREWTQHTRPIVEAYFHTRWVLDMMIRYGQELKAPPNLLPSGWAAVLYLYNLR